MSTVKVVNVQHPSASEPSITLDSDGGMSGGFPSPNRNLLYNGAMQVAQRGTSTASITTSGYYTADRWGLSTSGSIGTFTISVEADAPFAAAGLSKSLKVLCTTADAAPAASDSFAITQGLEGQDLQRIKKGSSDAQQLTLSFWVKANVTGTYVVEFVDVDNSRRVSASYSISASATWEKKTITFPADTTGGFDNDNASSLLVRWWLGAGSNFTSGSPLQTAWGTTTNTRATGQTNLAAATDNYWQITGVQLETGAVATPFEFKPYGQELAECQRYYYLHADINSKTICSGGYYTATYVTGIVTFPTAMRAVPTLVASSGTDHFLALRVGDVDYFNSFLMASPGRNGARVYNNSQASGTVGHAAFIEVANAAAYVAFSAEL